MYAKNRFCHFEFIRDSSVRYLRLTVPTRHAHLSPTSISLLCHTHIIYTTYYLLSIGRGSTKTSLRSTYKALSEYRNIRQEPLIWPRLDIHVTLDSLAKMPNTPQPLPETSSVPSHVMDILRNEGNLPICTACGTQYGSARDTCKPLSPGHQSGYQADKQAWYVKILDKQFQLLVRPGLV